MSEHNDGCNSAERIAELRKRITVNKGKAQRARDTAAYLNDRAASLNGQITVDRREIVALGGKVRS